MFIILSFIIPFTICLVKCLSDGYDFGEAFSMGLIGGFMFLFLAICSLLDGGSNEKHSGVAESAHYNTDYATGKQIALLKDINDKLAEQQREIK